MISNGNTCSLLHQSRVRSRLWPKWETSRELHCAMGTLSDQQKRTLLLRYFGNLAFSEIADIMGTPLNTVLSHLSTRTVGTTGPAR